MEQNLETLSELIMTVVNGQVSPRTLLVQTAQDAAKQVIAKAKHAAQTAKIVVPQQAAIAKEIGELEMQKVPKLAEIKVRENELTIIDAAIDAQQKILDEVKKAQALEQNLNDIKKARKKAKGETVEDTNEESQENNKVRKQKNILDEQKKKREEVNKNLEKLNHEVEDIDKKIGEKQQSIRVLAAQLNPTGALMEAKEKTNDAQSKVDSAPTPEARKEAEKELEDAQKEEAIIQQISDDEDTAVENEEKKDETKMMQMRAEYQVMDSGIATIQYLTTNIPILLPAMSVSIGVNGGGPLPVIPSVTLPLGNILYGYGFFILATVKAASIRFLALAKELEYTPTAEMDIINLIAPTEVAWKSAMTAFAPAGATLI